MLSISVDFYFPSYLRAARVIIIFILYYCLVVKMYIFLREKSSAASRVCETYYFCSYVFVCFSYKVFLQRLKIFLLKEQSSFVHKLTSRKLTNFISSKRFLSAGFLKHRLFSCSLSSAAEKIQINNGKH